MGQARGGPKMSVVKTFDDLPCVHRAWRHEGRCRLLHGYSRSFDVEFTADELDANGFVVDFSALDDVRELLREQFDHTVLVERDDPLFDEFVRLDEAGAARVRVMDHTGMEGAAMWVLDTVDRHMSERSGGRVRVARVVARENAKNAVTVVRGG
jgi:6-pyruvoyltetrahydropterin/6-carboxytetrahydropterin synthase